LGISIFDFFHPLPRQGPGDDALTLSLLQKVQHSGPPFFAVDVGCGTGAQSAVLAESGFAHMVVTDIHTPFVRDAQAAVRTGKTSQQVSGVTSDMARPPFRPSSIDLLLCEGAAYVIGFDRFLETWRPMLHTGGWLLLSDAVWTTDEVPTEAREFWTTEYPSIGTVSSCASAAAERGFVVRDVALLPGAAWEEFYRTVELRLTEVRPELSLTEEGRAFRDAVQVEIDIWRRHGWSYSYVFLLLQAC